MADGDLSHFTQVGSLDGELVFGVLLKVVFVIVKSPFTLNDKNVCKVYEVDVRREKNQLHLSWDSLLESAHL